MKHAPDPDDQRWRITFVRLLLYILLLYYLASIVVLGFLSPNHATVRDLTPILALLVCFAFASVAITRLRGEAIVALATAAFLSIWFLVQTLLYTPVMRVVFSRAGNWRITAAVIIAVASSSLPTLALFVLWPLRPRLPVAYADGDEPLEDSQDAPADPPIAPPE